MCDHESLRLNLSFAERIFQRLTLWREQLSTIFSDAHIVFQAHSKFTANINARLVAEGHVRGKRQGIATNQVRPLVSIHSDAVPHAMGEIFVVWTITGIGNYLARCCIDCLTLYSRLRRGERRRL